MNKLLTFIKSHTQYPVVSVIRLQGMVNSSKGVGNFSLESSRKKIDDAFKPDRLAEVLISVNSPGGSPVQSDLITSYIKLKASKDKVPVTVFVEDMAASGGYWIACAGSKIFASKTSIVGSLGVIYGGLGFTELIKKVGIERRLITAGENKALMDPFSPLKESDVEIVKKMLSESHQVFIDHVKSNRGMNLQATDEELFNGAIWTGEAAVKLGLVDDIKNMDEYIQDKYGDKVKVKRVKSKYEELSELFGGKAEFSLNNILNNQRNSFN